MPPQFTRTKNFGISQHLAILIAVIGTLVAAVAIVITILIWGIDESSTPVVLPLMGTLGLMITSLITALKASESADSASKAKETAELTASQTAAMHQEIRAEIGTFCPHPDCPNKSVRLMEGIQP